MKPDNNFQSYAGVSDLTVVNQEYSPDDPSNIDDVLKISHSERITFIKCDINPKGGNREDGVDVMNNSKNIRFSECSVGCGKYAFTIKGGSNFVWLDNVVIHGKHGIEGVDIDIGNFSSTVPDDKTGIVMLDNVTRKDGKPVRVRVGWASYPVITGGNVKVLFWQSLILKAYVAFKRLIA